MGSFYGLSFDEIQGVGRMKVKISLAGLPGVGKTQTLMKTIDILEELNVVVIDWDSGILMIN